MLTTFSLFLSLPLLATAQLRYPGCQSSWSWTYNSLGQNPCAVAARLQGACNNGAYTVPDLVPGDSYLGPVGAGDAKDLCKCNTVVYSLMSACDACQGERWFSWATWSKNCSATDPPTTFSNTIPNNTSVQEWAFIDVTKEGIWDPILSYQVGNQTEAGPDHPGTLAATPTPTTTETSVPGLSASQAHFLGKKDHSKPKIAGIVGGIFGGLAIVGAAATLWLWRARVKRRKATRAAAEVIFANRALPLQEKTTRVGEESQPGDVPLDVI